MIKSKARLAFEMLEKEMELLIPEETTRYLGGTSSDGSTIWGIDSQGNFYYKYEGETTWTAFNPLNEVTVTSNGNSTLNNMYSDYLYWKNQTSSTGYNTGQYSSTGYNSNGYNSNGYNSNGNYGGGGGGGGISYLGNRNSNSGSYLTPQSGGTPGSISSELMQTLTDIWNGPVMRALIPDLISINVSANFVPLIGSGQTLAINFITRGDASVSLTWSGSFRAGLHADASANLSVGRFLGDAENISLNSLLGTGYDASLDLEAVGVGGWISPSSNPNTIVPTWIGASLGVGPGAGGSGGKSETYLIYINGKPMVWDF
ncbi:hypothetical protein [Pedobacter suwonensis]|uniref:hypothetical protein n=1 Tax=Pedobacter suwonensis TaxID=332999 RepID=UPI0011A315E9|nr:hypothetical protein [Pedobacter suwonensis]